MLDSRNPTAMRGLPRRWFAVASLCFMALAASTSSHAGCSKY